MTFKRLSLIFIIFFLAFILIKLPFAILKPSDNNLTLQGTIWNGQAGNIATPFGPASLSFKANPLSLLTLSVAGNWAVNSRGIKANGNANFNPFTNPSIKDSTVDINLAALNLEDAIVGSLMMDIRSLNISPDGKCLSVDGTAKTDALIRSQDILKWQGPMLEGSLECLDGDFILNLSGIKAEDKVNFTARFDRSGKYQNTITLESPNPVLGLALVYQGFDQNGERFTMERNGAL